MLAQVSNAANFSLDDWANDIDAAITAHIDAFALNVAYGDETTDGSLSNAFTVANEKGFKLFFSFDYPGGTMPWPASSVTAYLEEYGPNGAYYLYNGQPFVSTFEGPANSADWIDIKAETNCFFMPDWSSLGADAAITKQPGVPDGLFSWAAWPYGPNDMFDIFDASYRQYLGHLPYMMPVSPWFFTNLPGFSKNWLWNGDHLWYDRWQEVLVVQPEFVEIITWNDWGESHYIGPLHDHSYSAFEIGRAPYNYALNMPHDGWRLFLPYAIDMYKHNISTVTQEGMVVWYRLAPGTACTTGGTTGNTISQYQCEYAPSDVVEDAVFYSALLSGPSSVSVSIGGVVQEGSWRNTPSGGIGIYHGSVPFNGLLGPVIVTVNAVGSVTGPDISTSCTDNIQNWNAWVGSAQGASVDVTPTSTVGEDGCIAGTGIGNYEGLCNFCCAYDYCPIGTCTCTALGPPVPTPPADGSNGYPTAESDSTYKGLCSFACIHGYCPDNVCSHVEVPAPDPPTEGPFPVCTPSPTSAPVCIAGTGTDNYGGLCSFLCHFGYCPPPCTCTATGPRVPAPSGVNVYGAGINPDDDSLCEWSCSHGYCPPTACTSVPGASGGDGTWCTAGTGVDGYDGLCKFSCSYGFCPSPCACTTYGAEPALPFDQMVSVDGYGLEPGYDGLCAFACTYNYCPNTACSSTTPGNGAGGGGSSSTVCVAGTGEGNYGGLCSFNCHFGYCPSPCTCTATSTTEVPPPAITNVDGAGIDPGDDSLCSFACLHGYCPPTACTSTAGPGGDGLVCVAGIGDDNYIGLCKFNCGYGYCPPPCTCTATGTAVPAPAITDTNGMGLNPADDSLCSFACSYGYCPETACISTSGDSDLPICTAGTGDGNYGTLCSFMCGLGFCPTPCTCTANGTQIAPPAVVNTFGVGVDPSYDSLCEFACSLGFCPASGCSSTSGTSSCTAGTGSSLFAPLCVFTCAFGFCPPPCSCSSIGPVIGPPPIVNILGSGIEPSLDTLCVFSCARGFCPATACKTSSSGCEGDNCDCDEPKTASACSVDCPATVVPWTTVTGSCTTTCTSTSTACNAVDSTTTSYSTTTLTYPSLETGTADPIYTQDLGGLEASWVYGEMQSLLSAESAAVGEAASTTTAIATPSIVSITPTGPLQTDTTLPTDLPTLTTSAISRNTNPCLAYTTITSCNAIGGQNIACATSTLCGVYSTPQSAPATTTSASSPTHHCLEFYFEADSDLTTVWQAIVLDNNAQVCNVILTGVTNTPIFACGNGYSVRVDASNPRVNYINTWYTSPQSNGEVFFEVPLLSDVTHNCGTLNAPLQCRIGKWESPGSC